MTISIKCNNEGKILSSKALDDLLMVMMATIVHVKYSNKEILGDLYLSRTSYSSQFAFDKYAYTDREYDQRDITEVQTETIS